MPHLKDWAACEIFCIAAACKVTACVRMAAWPSSWKASRLATVVSTFAAEPRDHSNVQSSWEGQARTTLVGTEFIIKEKLWCTAPEGRQHQKPQHGA
eukprot:1143627-Pelagomonas_calceolata.AAC.2